MLGQTYMVKEDIMQRSNGNIIMSSSSTNRPKRHTVNMNTEVFGKLREYVSKWGRTKEDVVNQAVDDYIDGRERFLKFYAPHLTLEAATNKAVMITDSELDNKIIVVSVKWNEDLSDNKKRGLI